MDQIIIPDYLKKVCDGHPPRMSWLRALPDRICNLQEKWSLKIGPPITENASCSWVAPSVTQTGTKAVLKVGLPHPQAEGEIDGLRVWDGDPTVFLLEWDREANAMLLERCEPGVSLHILPEEEQDLVVADILKRLWRKPINKRLFRSLSHMVANWESGPAKGQEARYDYRLAAEGNAIQAALAEDAEVEVMLATDLHAGNILSSQRKPWLVIDPKPYYGDPAYDATQHLLNCKERLQTDPLGTIGRLSGLLDLDSDRLRRWMFSRLASESHVSDQALARHIGLP